MNLDKIKEKINDIYKKAKDKVSGLFESSHRHGQDTSYIMKKYRNLTHGRKHRKLSRVKKRAEYLATLPKKRWKRWLHHLKPKNFYNYWFSKKGMIMAAKIAGVGFAVFVLLIVGLFAYFRKDLPDPKDINSRLLKQTTQFYDRTGEHKLFELYGDQNRVLTDLDDISDHAKNATIAIEDKDFYNHGGFSLRGVIRAAWNNFFGSSTQGGSTITQQFIKNSLLTSERTFTRKLKELFLSIEFERLYSKDEILGFYLNEIPYGGQEYGIEAASQGFFDKRSKKLTIDESAMLAALPQAPTYYSPYGTNTEALVNRQHTIINLMRDQGYITAEEAEAAKKVDTLKKVVPITQKSLYRNIKAPHFVLEVQRQLEEEFGASLVQNGGLKVITTLDWDLQKIAEKAVRQNMDNVLAGGADNASFTAEDVGTGQVVAMVGSRSFKYPKYGSYNAALANRQPGSSFKPYSYAELFKTTRWGPDSFIYDTKTSFGDYAPQNFDGGFRGKLTVRQALAESRNIPAVKSLYIAGLQNVIDLAKDMGNTTLGPAERYGLSLVLGSGEVKLAEHVHGYATFARGGENKEQSYMLKVENANGEVLKEWTDEKGKEVLDPQVAYLVTDILTDEQARIPTFGANNPAIDVPNATIAVKTGTTDSFIDGWMMGYSKYLAAGVWAGNHDNTEASTFGSNLTGPIWSQFMRDAHREKKLKNRDIFDERPEGIKRVRMNASTGYAATPSDKNTYWGLFPSWYEKELPSSAKKYTADKISGGVATSCTPDAAKVQKTSKGLWPELLPDDPWFNLWGKSAGYSKSGIPTKKDDVHKCSDKLPGVSLDVTQLSDGIYEFEATITKGTHKLDELNFRVDGQVVSSQIAKSPGKYTYTHVIDSTGKQTVTAQVIDSVLYDNTSGGVTVNVTKLYDDDVLEFTSPSGSADHNNVYFAWEDDPAASQYRLCWWLAGDSDLTCSTYGGSTNDATKTLQDNKNYEAFIQSKLNGQVLDEARVSFSTT